MDKRKIIFDKAGARKLQLQTKGGGVTAQIEFGALFTADVAKQIGVDHLLFRDKVVPMRSPRADKKSKKLTGVREGFAEVDLDFEMGQTRIELHPKGISAAEMLITADKVHKCTVRKGQKGGLSCRFWAVTTADPLALVNYLMLAGEAEGRLELEEVAQQQPLEEEAPKKRGRKTRAAAATNGDQMSIEDAPDAQSDDDTPEDEAERARRLRSEADKKGAGYLQ